MATYFVDAKNGDNKNNALNENEPVREISAFEICPGDTVLFKRGTVIRNIIKTVSGIPGKPVAYGAYGKGKRPMICGSKDLSDEKMWIQTDENIWAVNKDDIGEAGNFIFNGGTSFGTLKWSKEELSEQGDFFDNCFGRTSKYLPLLKDHMIYLWSRLNPALYYSHIEIACFDHRQLAENGHDVIFKDIAFINSAVHGIAGENLSINMKITDCSFINIGGAVYDEKIKVRFGNGVEMWNVGNNVTVTGCYFNNIYDSGITHQGGDKCEQAKDLIFTDNLFIKCGMGAYEQRDRMPISAVFADNICINAGEGFSKLGEVMPRKSEIWPKPMGHHIFLWRIGDEKTGKIEFKNNIFYNSPYGAAVYSIISEKSEDMCEFSDNTYYTENHDLLCRWHGKDISKIEGVREFDADSSYKNIDIDEEVSEWKKKYLADEAI